MKLLIRVLTLCALTGLTLGVTGVHASQVTADPQLAVATAAGEGAAEGLPCQVLWTD